MHPKGDTVKIAKRLAPALILCAAAGWMTVVAQPAQASVRPTTAAAHTPTHTCSYYRVAPTQSCGYMPAYRTARVHYRPLAWRTEARRFPGHCDRAGWHYHGRTGYPSHHRFHHHY
jgi:hypothetical protein